MQLLQRDSAVRKSRIMSQHGWEAEKRFRRQRPTWRLRAQCWEMNERAAPAALRCWRSGKSCLCPALLSCRSGDSKRGLEPHFFVFLIQIICLQLLSCAEFDGDAQVDSWFAIERTSVILLPLAFALGICNSSASTRVWDSLLCKHKSSGQPWAQGAPRLYFV